MGRKIFESKLEGRRKVPELNGRKNRIMEMKRWKEEVNRREALVSLIKEVEAKEHSKR
jgi:hypothetical protein